MNAILGKTLCLLNLHCLGKYVESRGGGAWKCGRCDNWVSKAHGKRVENERKMDNGNLLR